MHTTPSTTTLQQAVQAPHQGLAMFIRLLPAALFLLAGLRKILAYGATVQHFSGLGLPLPGLVTPLVIAIEIVLPLLFIAGWRLRELGVLLALYTVATGVVAHQFWAVPDAQFGNQFNHFFKNVAIAGGFLLAAFPTAAATARARP
ncbi:DoxX family protein [Herbaspirillum sp. NPDC087042]|uniref:DoxX family protein n=1 Tax=Herbaspirillum sp. NPDC087042 TaxID=3364004 RepID=UPI0037F2CACA